MSDTDKSKTVPRTVVVIAGTVVILAILATYLLMELNGKSSASLLPLLTGLIAAAGATAAWSNTKDTKKDTAEIKDRTNGPLTEGLDRIGQLEASVEELKRGLLPKEKL